MRHGEWSENDDKFLIENYTKMPSPQIAMALHRSIVSIRHRAVRLKITTPHPIPQVDWSEEEDEFLRTHYATMTAPELAHYLKRGVRGIRKRAGRLNLTFVDARIARWLDPANVPQMTPFQIGYLAGIVDGEGTISIHKCRPTGRGGQFRYQPTMSIAGTDSRLTEYLGATLDATQNSHIRRRERPEHKPQFVTGWYGYRCYPIIKLVEPHLLIKREQAQIVMRYIESRAQMPGYNHPYTDEQHELYERIRQLNLRGLPLE